MNVIIHKFSNPCVHIGTFNTLLQFIASIIKIIKHVGKFYTCPEMKLLRNFDADTVIVMKTKEV